MGSQLLFLFFRPYFGVENGKRGTTIFQKRPLFFDKKGLFQKGLFNIRRPYQRGTTISGEQLFFKKGLYFSTKKDLFQKGLFDRPYHLQLLRKLRTTISREQLFFTKGLFQWSYQFPEKERPFLKRPYPTHMSYEQKTTISGEFKVSGCII